MKQKQCLKDLRAYLDQIKDNNTEQLKEILNTKNFADLFDIQQCKEILTKSGELTDEDCVRKHKSKKYHQISRAWNTWKHRNEEKFKQGKPKCFLIFLVLDSTQHELFSFRNI